MMERTHDGRVLKILLLIDEYARRHLALQVARQVRSNDLIDVLAETMVNHGVPACLRPENTLTAQSSLALRRTAPTAQ